MADTMTDQPRSAMQSPPDDADLLIPSVDVANPEFTILVPALNEELTIGQFVD
jgi:hypothetical protein